MNPLVIVIIIAVAAGAGFLAHGTLVRKYDPAGRLARKSAEEKARRRAEQSQARKNAIVKLGEMATNLMPMARDSQNSLELRLQRAGWRLTPGAFVGVSAMSTVVGLAVGLLLAATINGSGMLMRAVAFALPLALGAALPYGLTETYARRRREKIERSLPRNLELLAIVVGAGQTIDTGIKTVGQRTQGPLAEEFLLASNDVAYYGKTTSEALDAMALRCDAKGVSLFVTSVKQAIQAGAPLKDNLRLQAEAATDRYFAELEEQTNKIRTKMIVPMVLFILPPIFIIALGPSVVSLLTELPKMF